jgi:hypothetical protein
MLRPYQYVGMLCYDDFALQTHKLAGTLLSDCGSDMCCQAYKERSLLLHKSPKVRPIRGRCCHEPWYCWLLHSHGCDEWLARF